MAQNIATLAVKFIADTYGLKAGAAAAEKIITQSAKSAGGNSLKAFGDFFKPGGNNASLQAFNKFFASAVPKTTPGSPFAAGWTKPLTALEKAGAAAKNAIGSQGGLSSMLTGLGPAGVAAGGALAGVALLAAEVGAACYVASKAWDQFWASAARIDAMSKLATRLDLTYGSLQRLSFIAADSNIAIETLSKAMEHMGRTIGSGGMDLNSRFTQQAKLIAKIKDPAQRAAEAYRIFGKEAGPLIPLLKTLGDNAARFDRYSGKFGFIIEEKDSKNIERMTSAWGDLGFIVTQIVDKFVSKFGGPVAAFLETIITLTEGWAEDLNKIGFTWEDVGGFAVSLMAQLSGILQFINAQHQIAIGFLTTQYGLYLKINAATSFKGSPEGDQAILAGSEMAAKGGKTTYDFFSGKLSSDFMDRVINGTDFSKRGSFGKPGGGEEFAPGLARDSEQAAKMINSAVAASKSPIEIAAEKTAVAADRSAIATERLVRIFENNPPLVALGNV